MSRSPAVQQNLGIAFTEAGSLKRQQDLAHSVGKLGAIFRKGCLDMFELDVRGLIEMYPLQSMLSAQMPIIWSKDERARSQSTQERQHPASTKVS